MVPRTLTALVGLPILVGIVWVGFPWLTIVVVAAALVGWWEFNRMCSAGDSLVPLTFGALWTALLVISGQLTSRWDDGSLPLLCYAVLGAGMVVVMPWLLWRGSGEPFMVRVRLASGPIYLGFLLAHALALRQFGDGSDTGRDWLLFALLCTFATDSSAFLVGRLLGRHLMAPSISPGKTWEGAAGGLLGSLVVGASLAALLGLPLGEAVGLAVAVGMVGQLGDLAESRLKRVVEVKDTSTLLPGHGGVLDRLDSIVFTMPVVYYLVALAIRP